MHISDSQSGRQTTVSEWVSVCLSMWVDDNTFRYVSVSNILKVSVSLAAWCLWMLMVRGCRFNEARPPTNWMIKGNQRIVCTHPNKRHTNNIVATEIRHRIFILSACRRLIHSFSMHGAFNRTAFQNLDVFYSKDEENEDEKQ